MTHINIRTARRRDLTEIRRMIQALAAFHGDQASITLSGLQSLLFDGGPFRAYIAWDGDQPVGFAAIHPHQRLHSGEITHDVQHLYVRDTHRSRGIGRALLSAVADQARDAGAFRLTIGTHPDNAGAQAAYRAMGWEEITGAGPRYTRPLLLAENTSG